MPTTRRRLVKMEDSVHGQIFNAPEVNQAGGSAEEAYLTLRQNIVRRYFPQATGADDFMARVEMGLCDYGFTPENSIGAPPSPPPPSRSPGLINDVERVRE